MTYKMLGEKQVTPQELENKLKEWEITRNYPEIDLDKYVDFYSVYPLFVLAPYTIKEKRKIPISKIYGNNWAFQDKQNRGSYPYSNKLKSLFDGYTKRKNNLFYKGRTIPPVPVVKIFGKYYLEEGNHRLYLSKLLNRKLILADVMEYDYEYFLKNSYLKFFGNIPCIIYENEVYQIENELTENYLKLKNVLENKKTGTNKLYACFNFKMFFKIKKTSIEVSFKRLFSAQHRQYSASPHKSRIRLPLC